VNLPGEISSKSVAKFFWKQELAEELQDLGLHDQWVFTQERGFFLAQKRMPWNM